MISEPKIHYYYGYGKGKTSAAVGAAIRAAGNGLRVLFIQFLKNTDSGEIQVLSETSRITVLRGTGTDSFSIGMTEEEKALAKDLHDSYLKKGLELMRLGECDVLVLDEIGDALDLGLADAGLVAEILAEGRSGTEIIMTGHGRTEVLVEAADYLTEMKKLRHPYDEGSRARKGIEY